MGKFDEGCCTAIKCEKWNGLFCENAGGYCYRQEDHPRQIEILQEKILKMQKIHQIEMDILQSLNDKVEFRVKVLYAALSGLVGGTDKNVLKNLLKIVKENTNLVPKEENSKRLYAIKALIDFPDYK